MSEQLTANPVPQNKSFDRNLKKQKIIKYIINDLTKLEKLDKNDISILIRACEIIENKCRKRYKLNKFEILKSAYLQLFSGITPDELTKLENNVNSLLVNGHIVKHSRIVRVVKNTVFTFIQKLFF